MIRFFAGLIAGLALCTAAYQQSGRQHPRQPVQQAPVVHRVPTSEIKCTVHNSKGGCDVFTVFRTTAE